MSIERRLDLNGRLSVVGETEERRAHIVAVGDPDEWVRSGQILPHSGELMLVGFSDVTEAFLELHDPPVIISPVLARNFDCIDLAFQLRHIGFRGRYRAVTDDIPSPDIVEREIRGLCPGLDFAVVASI